jgi:hypothetical protein
VGLVAARDRQYKTDVVLEALKHKYPADFGIEGKESVCLDKDVTATLKAAAFNEKTSISEIIREALKAKYSPENRDEQNRE